MNGDSKAVSLEAVAAKKKLSSDFFKRVYP